MTISGWNRDRLRELGLDAALVPPGIDLETFRPLPDVARRDDMLLALGRTNPLKNLPLTIDAWRGARRERAPELVPVRDRARARAASTARTTSSGRATRASTSCFNQATVFVQTSTHEGFCLPPLEAMATGGAVVCTDAHGNRDFCVDGVNCLMPGADASSR